MTREFTCIVCPNGCRIETEYTPALADADRSDELIIHRLTGNLCPRGRDYVVQELTDPRRTIATSVLVDGGELPLASVRLTAPIPKDRLFDAMNEIRACRLKAPVKAGTVIIRGLLGYNCDVIVTRSVGTR